MERQASAQTQTTPEGEVESLIGGNVRSPVGIPKQYRPLEVSGHELLRVELSDFAGPLDLLVYLIRQHDIDVFDIPIAFITEKYLEMLDKLEDLPIEAAAEFLVMAAELAHIKSKMLLPPKEGIAVEAEEEDEGDPRADLVRRLLEYQKYRDVAQELQDRDQLGRDVFARRPPLGGESDDFDGGLRDLSIFRLVEAMAEVLSRLEPERHHEVMGDSVSITERMEAVMRLGREAGGVFSFLALFSRLESRRVVVTTFLAILELVRVGAVRIQQPPESYEDDVMPLPKEVQEAFRRKREAAEATSEPRVADLDPDPSNAPAQVEAGEPLARPRLLLAYELPPLRAPDPELLQLELTGFEPIFDGSGFAPLASRSFEDADVEVIPRPLEVGVVQADPGEID